MVPISQAEILFLGGKRPRRYGGEVAVLNLTDLKGSYGRFCKKGQFSFYTNSYNISKTGEVTAVVEKNEGSPYDSESDEEYDLICYPGTCSGTKVLAANISSHLSPNYSNESSYFYITEQGSYIETPIPSIHYSSD